MLTFRKGRTCGLKASLRMAAHLMEPTLPPDLARHQADLGGPGLTKDGGLEPKIRADIDPGLALLLNLDGRRSVDLLALAHLLRGRRSDGQSIQHREACAIASLDCCFSCEKSISLLWAGAGPAARAIVAAAHREAVDLTMKSIARAIGRSRLGKGGRDGYEGGHVAWITCEQYTSRVSPGDPSDRYHTLPGDPQIHSHVIVPHVVRTRSGRVSALDLRGIDGRIREFGHLYLALTIDRLMRYGVEFATVAGQDIPRAVAVSPALREMFSKRTRHGEERARRYSRGLALSWDDLAPARRVGLAKSGVQKAFSGARKDDLADIDGWRRQAEPLGGLPRVELRAGAAPRQLSRDARLSEAAALTRLLVEAELQERDVIDEREMRRLGLLALMRFGIDHPEDIADLMVILRSGHVMIDGVERSFRIIYRSGARGGEVTLVEVDLIESEREELRRSFEDACAWPTTGSKLGGPDKTADDGTMPSVSVSIITQGMSAEEAWKGAANSAASAGYSVTWIGALRRWEQVFDTSSKATRPTTLDSLLAGRGDDAVVPERTIVFVDNLASLRLVQLLRLMRWRAVSGVPVLGGLHLGTAPADDTVFELLPRQLRLNIPYAPATAKSSDTARETARLISDGLLDRALFALRQQGRASLALEAGPGLGATVADLFMNVHAEHGVLPSVRAETADDARVIAAAIRERKRAAALLRGPDYEIDAVDRDGAEFQMRLAVGESIRFISRVNARREDGKRGLFGVPGTVVTVTEIGEQGLRLRNDAGLGALVNWNTLRQGPNRRIGLEQPDVELLGRWGRAPRAFHIDAISGLDVHVGSSWSTEASASPGTQRFMVFDEKLARQKLARVDDIETLTTEDLWLRLGQFLTRSSRDPVESAYHRAVAVRCRAEAVLRNGLLATENRISAGKPRSTLDLRFALHRQRTEFTARVAAAEVDLGRSDVDPPEGEEDQHVPSLR